MTYMRIIRDNGPQFVSREFKQYIRICGMTHVRTSPYYPQSNGKLERYHWTIKSGEANGRARNASERRFSSVNPTSK